MSFRDESDAQRERIETLERELEAAKRAVQTAEAQVESLPDLRRKLGQQDAEIERLKRDGGRAEPKPGWPAVALVVAIGLGSLGIVYAVETEANDELRAQLSATSTLRDDAERERDEARDELASAEARIGALETAARMPAPVPPSPPPSTFTFPIVTATASTTFMTTGRVSAAMGDAPVRRGAECTVAITLDGADECRAQVICGEEELYPRSGEGGYFATCEHDTDRSFLRGGDVGTTDLDGDPRIDVDRARGTAVIGEGPSPSWEVTVRFAPDR